MPHVWILPMETTGSTGQSRVAPARKLAARPHFPVMLTSFLGREPELAEVVGLLRRCDVRLLTLTGPGGVGKTRLALAVASALATEFGGGVIFVALAAVRDPGRVAGELAQHLGLGEAGHQTMLDAIVNALDATDLLLVLDNYEHVIETAPLIDALLARCPGLTVLVTSRAVLRLSGEREYPLAPLALPAPDASQSRQIAAAAAVRLFVERATAVDPGFTLTEDNAAAVAAICARLDGLPLAIELAAARGKVLPPALLLPRLAHRLPLLTGGPRNVPARLQTMRAAISWSHDLLTVSEQVLFRWLAVFSGGFTLEAAETIGQAAADACGEHGAPSILDGIASLTDKSLLHWRGGPDRDGRLEMLETIREFAHEQLVVAGELDAARTAHAVYFAGFDERLDPNRVAPGELFDDRLWRIEVEYANFQTALTYLAEIGEGDGVLRLAGALSIFWHHRGNLAEGRRWLEWALTNTADTATAERARALAGLSLVLWSQSDTNDASTPAQAALAIAEAIDHAELATLAKHLLAVIAQARSDLALGTSLMTNARAGWRALGLRSNEAMALRVLGWIEFQTEDFQNCARYAQAALAIFHDLGHPSGAAGSLLLLALVATSQGNDHQGMLLYQEGLQVWSRIVERWSPAMNRQGVGVGEPPGFPRWAGVDDRRMLLWTLTGLARIAAAHGQPELAARLIGSADFRLDQQVIQGYVDPRTNRNRAAALAVATLGETRFVRAHAAGQHLRLDEVVALALSLSIPDGSKAAADEPDRAMHPVGNGPLLTRREFEVLRLVVAGRSDREIASVLFIGHRTAQDHVSHIIGKLGVVNRTEAAAVAVRDGLV